MQHVSRFVVSGLLTLIGIAVWQGKYVKGSPSAGYATMVGIISCILVALSGVFQLLEIVGVKAGGGCCGGGGSGSSTVNTVRPVDDEASTT